MEAKASARNMRGSAQKARLVVDLIRGKNVANALAILQFTHKRAADIIAKCLKSAIANANFAAEKQNIAIDPDDLWITSCFVDIGPTKRRYRMRPAPQGRAYRERRHYCHITVEVSSDKPAAEVAKDKTSKAAKERSANRPKLEKMAKAQIEAKPNKKSGNEPVEEVQTPVTEVPAAEAIEQNAAEVNTEVHAAENEAVEAKADLNAPDLAETTVERKTESTTTEVVTDAAAEGDKKE
jgi:large subunit ribosomal protein L22